MILPSLASAFCILGIPLLIVVDGPGPLTILGFISLALAHLRDAALTMSRRKALIRKGVVGWHGWNATILPCIREICNSHFRSSVLRAVGLARALVQPAHGVIVSTSVADHKCHALAHGEHVLAQVVDACFVLVDDQLICHGLILII